MRARFGRGTEGMPIPVGFCLPIIAVALVFFAALAPRAHAAEYKMVACGGNSGIPPYTIANNTFSPQNPGGIFEFNNWCGGAGGDPPGEAAFMRLNETQPSGNAGQGAAADIIFDTPAYVHFRVAGGYTREPNAFNDGWRARFWFVYLNGTAQQQFVQGAGLPNSGGLYATTSTFAPHLWEWPYPLDFNRWVFELECVRAAGCDRSNYNAVDLNGLVFILSDDSPSQVAFTDPGSALMQGSWVRGAQSFNFNVADQGSGLRVERLRIDGAQRWEWDHWPECSGGISSSPANGEWARTYQPCPVGGPWGRSVPLDTATLADGAHTVSACTQDYAQFQGLNGTGGESCDQRTIRTDNTPPGAPSGLIATSANPARYLRHFGAQFSLPPNQGSPITEVHYNVVNAAGEVVEPEQTYSATNPTEVPQIEGPAKAGDYRLRVWLSDEVGFEGPASTTPIPHDTTPPAAPQGVSVTSPTTPRSAEGFDLRWRNVLDAGSPIDAAHYQVLDAAGKVVVPTQTTSGEGVQGIQDLEVPSAAGSYQLRLWLEDEEGNVGAPVSAPLAYECLRSQVGGATSLSAGFGGQPSQTLRQDQGAALSGALRAADGSAIATAPVCVYSRVETDQAREFLGIALTDQSGGYRFPVPAGPSREVSAIYRPDNRELKASAMIQTVVHPTLRARKSVVRNGSYGYFEGDIPGPDNDGVTVVLQVKSGKGWLAFRRYNTRAGGHYEAAYHFRRTDRPTTYEMRAQIRQSSAYPYLQGESDPLALTVVPGKARHPAGRRAQAKVRCAKGQRRVGRRGKGRCVAKSHNRHRAAARHGEGA